MNFLVGSANSLSKPVLAIVLAAGALACATPAAAKYSAIDSSGTKTLQIDFSGYCDATVGDLGDECGGPNKILPYQALFAGGATNKLVFRSDGVLQFVGDYISNADPINQFKVLAQVDAGFADTFYPQIAGFQQVGKNFIVKFFQCGQPQHCYTSRYSMVLAPVYRAGDEGFDVKFKYAPDSGIDPADRQANYFLPAIFDNFSAPDAVPEPGVWSLLILGFGGVGAALRRGRKPRSQTA
jgi:hypothetical protein